MNQKILLLGSGGREHALAINIKKSPFCEKLYIAPGNGGTGEVGQNVEINMLDFESVSTFALQNEINLIVVGPEAPLVAGIVDYFQKDTLRHIKVVGPDAYSAQLEGSKAFAKSFMDKYRIPTAGYVEVTADNMDSGTEFLKTSKPPYVLKADGLAAGKGVLIIHNLDEAIIELKEMLGGKFGAASSKVVLEEFLDGIEFSVFVLTDGSNYVLLPQAKDYKRVGEGDIGLNTGGMGAASPVPFFDDKLKEKVIKNIVEPTIFGIGKENMNYKGFVFFGLIRVGDEPFVIEYNCRLGDPETEVVLPRLDADILELFLKLFDQSLQTGICSETPDFAATVMLVSGGYPGTFEKGKNIHLPVGVPENVQVFHAATKKVAGDLVTDGGRVIAVTSKAKTKNEAIQSAISYADNIQFDGKYFRRDIGFDL